MPRANSLVSERNLALLGDVMFRTPGAFGQEDYRSTAYRKKPDISLDHFRNQDGRRFRLFYQLVREPHAINAVDFDDPVFDRNVLRECGTQR